MPDIPVTSGSQNITLHVEDHGQGRPVVLIHGWPLSGESWTHQVAALAENHRVITYDRRGFGRSEKPAQGYDYDTLSDDLAGLLETLDLRDVTLVGFSMGGGEVARYVARHGQDRLRSVVFAGAVPPMMLQTQDNPDGPLTPEAAHEMRTSAETDREGFFPDFVTTFFSIPDGEGTSLLIDAGEHRKAVELCQQSDQRALLGCMDAFGATDFREDLTAVSVPTLVLHGGADQVVPYEGSGQRTAQIIDGAQTTVIDGAPHGFNVSHAQQFNQVLSDFLAD